MKRTQANSVIDRDARDKMATAVERYLNEEITAFEFDDALEEIVWNTQDDTVREERIGLWGLYDDMSDHKVKLEKSEWDYCQRVLLLLKSDARIQTTKRRKWTVRQTVAAACTVSFLLVVGYWGVSLYLLIATLLFGIMSMILQMSRPKTARKEEALYPFPTVADILKVRKSVPDFAKSPYPSRLKRRRRGGFWSVVIVISEWLAVVVAVPLVGFLWLLLSPIVLLIQVIPERLYERRLILP